MPTSPSVESILNGIIAWLSKEFAQEWASVREAPIAFLISVIGICCVIELLTWLRRSARIAGLESRNRRKDRALGTLNRQLALETAFIEGLKRSAPEPGPELNARMSNLDSRLQSLNSQD